MKHLCHILPITIVSAIAFTGCIDNNYDLANIDTTTEIKVNNLAIPLNVGALALEDIVELSDDSPIKTLTDAKGNKYYAIQKGGDFKSSAIKVAGIEISAPQMTPTTATFAVGSIIDNFMAPKRRKARRITIPGTTIDVPETAPAWSYNFSNSNGSEIEYSARNIDESVKGVSYLGVKPMTIAMEITLQTDNDNYYTELNNLEIQIIDGFDVDATSEGTSYNKQTGVLKVTKAKFVNGKCNIWLRVKGMDFAAAGIVIRPDHSVIINKKFNLLNAEAKIGMKQAAYDDFVNTYKDKVQNAIMTGQTPPGFSYPEPPNTVSYGISYSVPNLVAQEVSGELEYKISGLNIDPVALTGIPDPLNDPENNLLLYNPQIYVKMDKNPVANAGSNGLGFATGLTLTANRTDSPSKVFTTPGDGVVIPGKTEGPFYYCISAQGAQDVPEGYGSTATYTATPNTFNGKDVQHNIIIPRLGDIVGGKGLPSSIGIELTNTAVWQQKVDKLQLPLSLPEVNGGFEFVCPLALRGASQDANGLADQGAILIYSQRTDGWNLSQLEDLHMDVIKINADLTSTLPLGVHLSATPLDKSGNPISGVTVVGADLNPNCKDSPISIVISGDVTALDGLEFTAVVTPKEGNTEAIKPSQKIELKNLKLVVSGKYIVKP